MTGRLIGIARRRAPKAPNLAVDRATVTQADGVAGNFRGSIRPGRSNRRQVSILLRSDWEAAMGELGIDLDWAMRRADLYVDGVYLPREKGHRVRIGAVLLEVTGECDPCSRMETIAPGLKAALTPDWRGGRMACVIEDGAIALGDRVSIEETS